MKKNYLVGYKLFFGLLGFSAIITEIAVISTIRVWNPAHFFSFFTIEANIIALIAFFMSAFALFAKKKSKNLDFFRGAATFYMVVTGIVFSFLLSGLDSALLTAVPWDNIVLHYIIPIAVVIDWIMDPPQQRIGFKKALLWVLFPIAYLFYSLIRGPIVHWYPYPFLDPANGGYGMIAVTSVIILIVGIVLAYIITRLGVKAGKSKK